eukprot:403366854
MGCDMSFLQKARLTGDGETTAAGSESFEKRILLLGLDNAGKTSLLYFMRDAQFKDTVPTVGLNIEHLQYKRYSLTFWDVGGQITKLWKHYFDKIDGVIFVIDSTDREKLQKAKKELQSLMVDQSIGAVPFLIYFNKQDLTDQLITQEEIEQILDLQSEEQNRTICAQCCSAFNGQGIWDGIDQIIKTYEDNKIVHLKQSSNKNDGDTSQIQQQSQQSANKKSQL